jgi:hypothetical protein
MFVTTNKRLTNGFNKLLSLIHLHEEKKIHSEATFKDIFKLLQSRITTKNTFKLSLLDKVDMMLALSELPENNDLSDDATSACSSVASDNEDFD